MTTAWYRPTWDLALDPLVSCKLCLGEYPAEQMTTLAQCRCVFCTLVGARRTFFGKGAQDEPWLSFLQTPSKPLTSPASGWSPSEPFPADEEFSRIPSLVGLAQKPALNRLHLRASGASRKAGCDPCSFSESPRRAPLGAPAGFASHLPLLSGGAGQLLPW